MKSGPRIKKGGNWERQRGERDPGRPLTFKTSNIMKDERVTQLITFRYFVTPEEIERESGLNSRFFEVVCYWHDKENERENKEAGSNLPPSEFDYTLVKVTLNQSENVLPLYVIFEQIIERCDDCRALLFVEDDFLTEDEI